jgi:hypothetical protein
MDRRDEVGNEFALLRSVLRGKGVLDLDLDNHLKRMQIVVTSKVARD